MSELGTESLGGLEDALGAAFSEAPIEKPAAQSNRPPEPDEQEPDAPAEGDPADLLEGQEPEEVETKPDTEPEFELEIEPGKPEVLPLSKLKELAARGAKAGRGFEENARVREALQAHVQQVQFQQQFQQAVSQDIAQVQAIDHQLQQQFGQIDWQKEFSEDPFNAMKLKEQRDQLREQRAAAVNNLNAKQQQFQAFVQQNTQKALAAENEALLAKVPAWRNAEKAKQEQGEIAGVLTSHYGFTAQEVGSLIDHRHLLVARDAAAYRKLLANKDAKVKQAREAPATAKPGATAPPNGRAEFNKVRGKIKELGTKGNHRAQEELAAKLFGAAFK
jgi:hypothetical protein